MRLLFTVILLSLAVGQAFSWSWWSWCPWSRKDNYYKLSLSNAMKIVSSDKWVVDSLKRERDSRYSWFCWHWVTRCVKDEIIDAMEKKYTISCISLKVGNDSTENNKTSFPIDAEMTLMATVEDMKDLGKNFKEIKFDVDDAEVEILDPVIKIENCNKIKEEGRELYNCKDDLKTTKKP